MRLTIYGVPPIVFRFLMSLLIAKSLIYMLSRSENNMTDTVPCDGAGDDGVRRLEEATQGGPWGGALRPQLVLVQPTQTCS